MVVLNREKREKVKFCHNIFIILTVVKNCLALTTNIELVAETTSPYTNLLLENFLNPNLSHGTDELKESFSNLTKHFFENADLATAYPNLFKLLWFSNIPCFKNNITDAFLLKKCFWNGKEQDCSDLFKQGGIYKR